MKAGDRLGRFELVREARSGGMGTVYLAIDRDSGELTAVKLLRDLHWRERFERESVLLAALDDPGIVRYRARDTRGEIPYLAMEWLEGEDLADRLRRGPLSVAESVELLRRVARALAVAHDAGITHRDLKPTNIFLVNGDLERPVLLDFGIAYAPELHTRMTASGALLGTPEYMAPEQARGEDVDARADVFALGCVVYACVTGRRAFFGDNVMAVLARILLEEPPGLRALQADAPLWLEALVRRMMAKSPTERPRDARALAKELDAISNGDLGPTLEAPFAGGISRAERRFLSVIVVAPAGHTAESLREAARATGASIFPLRGGSYVAVQEGEGAASDHASRAARCALLLAESAPGVALAVATGRGTVGEVAPVGEVIDRATQLLDASITGTHGTGRVVIDDITLGLLDESFEVRRDAESGAATLLRRREDDGARTLLGKPTRCVGRDNELATLEAILDEALEEPLARAVIVTGAPGIGKSRLRQELLRRTRARRPEAEIWSARADSIGAHSAFGLAAQTLRRISGILEGEPLATRREKLLARVRRHVPEAERARIGRALGEMVGVRDEDGPPVSSLRDAVVEGDRMRRAWTDFVEHETAAHPLVLVLEDLHWGDPTTVHLVDAMLNVLANRPVAVIAFARPEVDDVFPGLWSRRSPLRIALPGLRKKAAEELVRDALGDVATPELAARIVERSGGNAFYLEELIRFAADGRSDTLPETVVAMATARLDALHPDARRVLRAASIFGQVAWAEGVIALGGLPPAVTRSWLDQLVELELMTTRRRSKFAGTRELELRHAYVREAAYATLTDADRALGHRLAADWLEQAGEQDAFVLAEHWERGEDDARARQAFARAASQAIEGADYQGARARAERAIARGAEGAELGTLRRLQTNASLMLLDYEAAHAMGRAAISLLEVSSEEWCESAGIYAIAGRMLNRVEELDALARYVQTLVDRDDAPLAHLRLGARIAAETVGGALDAVGQDLLTTLAARKGASTDASTLARIERAHARVALLAGDLSGYVDGTRRARAHHEAAGEQRLAFHQTMNLLYGLGELGLSAEGLEEVRALAPELRRSEREMDRAIVAFQLAALQRRSGQLTEAIATAELALEVFQRHGVTRNAGHGALDLALVHRALGDHEAEETWARRAEEWLRSSPMSHPHSLGALSRAVTVRGASDEALALAERALEEFTSLGKSEGGETTIHLALPEALLAIGRVDEARAAILGAREHLLARAAKIKDEAARATFLSAIEENRDTLALARRLAPQD